MRVEWSKTGASTNTQFVPRQQYNWERSVNPTSVSKLFVIAVLERKMKKSNRLLIWFHHPKCLSILCLFYGIVYVWVLWTDPKIWSIADGCLDFFPCTLHKMEDKHGVYQSNFESVNNTTGTRGPLVNSAAGSASELGAPILAVSSGKTRLLSKVLKWEGCKGSSPVPHPFKVGSVSPVPK